MAMLVTWPHWPNGPIGYMAACPHVHIGHMGTWPHGPWLFKLKLLSSNTQQIFCTTTFLYVGLTVPPLPPLDLEAVWEGDILDLKYMLLPSHYS